MQRGKRAPFVKNPHLAKTFASASIQANSAKVEYRGRSEFSIEPSAQISILGIAKKEAPMKMNPKTPGRLSGTENFPRRLTLWLLAFCFGICFAESPSILVMPAKSGKGTAELTVLQRNPLARAALETVQGYLTERLYDVRTLEGQKDLDRLVLVERDLASEEDLAYVASLSLSADFYIKFAGAFSPEESSVELTAYETSSAHVLGSSIGRVKNDAASGKIASIQKATEKALPDLEKKIRAYLEKDKADGVPYKIVIRLSDSIPDENLEDSEAQIFRTMKAFFKKVRTNSASERTMDVLAFADAEKYAEAQDVYLSLADALKHFLNVKKICVTKKLILLEVR